MCWQILLKNNCRGSIFKWIKLQVGSLLILHTESKKVKHFFHLFFFLFQSQNWIFTLLFQKSNEAKGPKNHPRRIYIYIYTSASNFILSISVYHHLSQETYKSYFLSNWQLQERKISNPSWNWTEVKEVTSIFPVNLGTHL